MPADKEEAAVGVEEPGSYAVSSSVGEEGGPRSRVSTRRWYRVGPGTRVGTNRVRPGTFVEAEEGCADPQRESTGGPSVELPSEQTTHDPVRKWRGRCYFSPSVAGGSADTTAEPARDGSQMD